MRSRISTVLVSVTLSLSAGSGSVAQSSGQNNAKAIKKAALSARSRLNGWKQIRKTTWLGESISYISDGGYVFSSSKMGINTICARNSARVYIVRPENKLYFVGSDSKGVTKMASTNVTRAIEFSLRPPAVPWTLERTTVFLGHPTAVWRSSELIHTPNKAPNFTGYEFWVAKDITIPEAMVKYNNVTHQWPLTSGLPLRLIHITSGKSIQANLETVSIEPSAVSPEIFTVPKDYSETKDERKVGLEHQDLGGIFDDLGWSSKAVKK